MADAKKVPLSQPSVKEQMRPPDKIDLGKQIPKIEPNPSKTGVEKSIIPPTISPKIEELEKISERPIEPTQIPPTTQEVKVEATEEKSAQTETPIKSLDVEKVTPSPFKRFVNFFSGNKEDENSKVGEQKISDTSKELVGDKGIQQGEESKVEEQIIGTHPDEIK